MTDDATNSPQPVEPGTQVETPPSSPSQFVHSHVGRRRVSHQLPPPQTPSPFSFEETETQAPDPAPAQEPPRPRPPVLLHSRLDGPTPHARDVTPLPCSDNDVVLPPVPLTRANAHAVVPLTITQGVTLLTTQRVTTAEMAEYLAVLNVRKASKLSKDLKKDTIAAVMVQLNVSLNDIQRAVDRRKGTRTEVDEAGHRIQNAKLQSVTTRKDSGGTKYIVWLDADSAPCSRPHSAPSSSVRHVVGSSRRQPDFEAGEFARLLHVLADARMSTAVQRIMRPRTRQELDVTTTDPWDEFIAELYNDDAFMPSPVHLLSGGVTRSDLDGIDPAQRPYHRTASTLKMKFGQLKSLYGTCTARFQASGQGDHEDFVSFAGGKSYILYCHCLVKQHPMLQSLATRALPTSAQREVGIESDPESDVDLHTPRSSAKRRRTAGREVTINGLETLSSAFGHTVHNAEVAKQTEEEELKTARALTRKANADAKRAESEAADSKAKAVATLIASLTAVKEHRANAQSPGEEALYDAVIKSLESEMRGTA